MVESPAPAFRPPWRPCSSGSWITSRHGAQAAMAAVHLGLAHLLGFRSHTFRSPAFGPVRRRTLIVCQVCPLAAMAAIGEPDAGPGPGPGARKKINPPSPSTANRGFPHYDVRAIGVSPVCPSPTLPHTMRPPPSPSPICLYCLARHLWPRPPRPHCPESRRRMKSELAARGACDVEDGLFECVALSFDEQCPHAPTGGHAEARPGTLLPSARYARRAGPLSSSGACVREDRQGAAAAPSAAWAAACRSHQ